MTVFVTALAGGRIVEHLDLLAGCRVGEAFPGGLPAAIEAPVAIMIAGSMATAIAPALEEGAENDDDSNTQCLHAGDGDSLQQQVNPAGGEESTAVRSMVSSRARG
jgi:hypothetical protein